MRGRLARGAYALPFVLLVLGLIGVLVVVFIQSNINMKQQNRLTFAQVQAHYLAQAGMQHALLKLRILPNESFEACALARGICPFLPPGTVPTYSRDLNLCLLEEFREDIRCGQPGGAPSLYPIPAINGIPPELLQSSYATAAMTAVSVGVDPGTAGTGIRNLTVEIRVSAEAVSNFKGEVLTRRDEIQKLVQIQRSVQ
jgi:type II secretory pathway pseudopilin PulG